MSEALCASVERLAQYGPACVLFLTGPGEDRAHGSRRHPAGGGRGRPRRRARRARADPERVSPPLVGARRLGEAAALLEEAGRPEVGLVFDTWHLWNAPGLLDDIAHHRDRIVALHVADWREPTRNMNDRVLPGDGVVDFGPIFEALAWDGLYDLEIFSDPELDGSLWREDPRELARRGVEALRSVSA